jgi:hypothetical protein
VSLREPLEFHVILRSPERIGTTKNLTVNACIEILRFAQNDNKSFPDGHERGDLGSWICQRRLKKV